MTERTPEEIQRRIRLAWDMDAPLPTPLFDHVCPSCRDTEIHPRIWHLAERKSLVPGRFTHRCNVSLKCTTCALIFNYGLVLTKEQFDRYAKTTGKRDQGGGITIHWREAKGLT